MLQLTQPIWLWAITGIAVPLVIHLWNIRQGKTLKVGSIAFLTESARAHSKSLRLSELWLLLLRCLLLILLALLLCQPVWIKQSGPQEKGWILLEPGNVKGAYTNYKAVIDSLLKAGYSTHLFERGFAETTLSDTAGSIASHAEATVPSYWSLLKELDQQVPAGLPLYLFTENTLHKFRGMRPASSLQLTWHTFPSKDTAASWALTPYLTIKDSIRVIRARSLANGTRYENETFPVSNKDLPSPDTSTLTMVIYTDTHLADANYLSAAFRAIRDFTQRKIKVTTVANVASIDTGAHWVFWLSEKNIPASLSKQQLLAYGTGRIKEMQSAILTGNPVEDLKVYKLVDQPATLLPVWENGYGDIVLGKDKNAVSTYRFLSRFDPQWNNLVWHEQFPQLLYDLVMKKEDPNAHYLSRVLIDNTQMQPARTRQSALLTKERLLQKNDLTWILWFLAFVLFLAERLLSFKTKKTI